MEHLKAEEEAQFPEESTLKEEKAECGMTKRRGGGAA